MQFLLEFTAAGFILYRLGDYHLPDLGRALLRAKKVFG